MPDRFMYIWIIKIGHGSIDGSICNILCYVITRYQPTEDEIDMYKAYAHKKHELHPVDQFMLELCEIPCLNIRIDICLTLWEFPWQFESTCQVDVIVEAYHLIHIELWKSLL